MAGEAEAVDLASLWKAAIADYEKETGRQFSQSVLATAQQIHNPDDLLRHIEASGQDFKDFRNKRAGLWHRLNSFVTPLGNLLDVAMPLSNVSDGFGIPASAAIGACLYLVRVRRHPLLI